MSSPSSTKRSNTCLRGSTSVEEDSAEPQDIAVVALDLAGYRALLAEEAERRGVSLAVGASPRRFLLLAAERVRAGTCSIIGVQH